MDYQRWLSEAKSKNVQDITREYMKDAKPGIGRFKADGGALEMDKVIARWIQKTFGGDIHVLQAANRKNQKSVDATWGGKLWELKSVSSRNSVDKQMQSGCNQLHEVHARQGKGVGGLVISITNGKISDEAAVQHVKDFVGRRAKESMDIIIKNRDDVVAVIRYKK